MPIITRPELEKRIKESEVAQKKVVGNKTIKELAKDLSHELVNTKNEAELDNILRRKYEMPKKLRNVFLEDISGKKFNKLIEGLKQLPLSDLNRELKFAEKQKIKIPEETRKKLVRKATIRQKLGVWATIEDREQTEGGPDVGLKRKNPLKGVLTGQNNKKVGAEDIGTEGVATLSKKSGFAMGDGGSRTTGRALPGSGGASIVAGQGGKASAGLTSGIGAKKSTPPSKLGGGSTRKGGGPPLGFRPKL